MLVYLKHTSANFDRTNFSISAQFYHWQLSDVTAGTRYYITKGNMHRVHRLTLYCYIE